MAAKRLWWCDFAPQITGKQIEEFARKLKKACGCGGTVDAGVIEIQGDHRDLLLEQLAKLGYTVRRSGG